GKVTLTEVKTAAYRVGRVYQQPVCPSMRKRILMNVMATVLKEVKAAVECGATYKVIFSDPNLHDAWVDLGLDVDNKPKEVDIGVSKRMTLTRDDLRAEMGIDDSEWNARWPLVELTLPDKLNNCGWQ